MSENTSLRSAIKGRISIDDPRIQMASLSGSITLPTVVHVNDIGKTIILVDDYGNEVTAVLSDEPVTLDATPNDIRIGKTAATVDGVTLGEKEIPSYNTREGYTFIPIGSPIRIRINHYNYTKLQALLCKYNETAAESVYTDIVSIEGKVYPVMSTEAISEVIVDHDTKSIDLGIINESDSIIVLRYFTYKELY